MTLPPRFRDALVNAKDRHVVAAARFRKVDVIVSNDKRLRREVNKMGGQAQVAVASMVCR